VSDSARQAPLPAIPLLVFAAIDIVLALLLLLAGGFSIQFAVIGLIGLALAAVGMWSVFSKAALARVREGDVEERPVPRILQPRRRKGRPPR
jgi:hypothetical protein